LESQAWERLMLLAEAKKQKITANDTEVIQQLASLALFKDNQGNFDNTRYAQILRYYFRTSPRVFEEQLRQNLIIAKLYQQLTNGITLSEEEIKENYKKVNEEMRFDYIAAAPSDFAKEINVSEEEVKNYFSKNSLQFKQPLSFNIEYASVAADTKDENAIQQKLKELMLRLKKKEDFKKVALDFGIEVKETGLFTQTDPIPGIGWSPEVLGLLLKARPGEYLMPVHIDKSYYIIKAKEKKEPYIPDFETIKDKVKERLIREKSRDMAKEKIEDGLKKLKEQYKVNPKAVDSSATSKLLGLKSSTTQLLKYGSYIEGVGVADTFFNAAQNLQENNFSEVINMPSGYYIIKVKEKIPVDEKKFSAEKTTFAQQLLMQKKQEYFSGFLEDLKKRATTNLP
ncbi:MAG: peptidyl-prolyl cis-trans isomerase, partial [Candidatus Omnitrophica bacterium]|nr:peptidyl-prolyl cis-trans isomerase [Candidatus Omnitrophota bacterium]